MARSEARLAASIWEDPDFLALNPTAQRMFMFLLSQRDLAHDGVIALRERRWSKSAAGLTSAQVAQDLKELHTARFIVIDEDAEELLIRSFIRRDKVFRQPNVLHAAADHLEVVTSPVIRAVIGAEVRRILDSEELKTDTAKLLHDMLAAIGNPSRNPPPNPSGNPSDEIKPIADAEEVKGDTGDIVGQTHAAIGNPSRNPSDMPTANPSGDVSAGNKGSGNPSDMPTAKGSQLRPGERGMVTVVPQGVSPFPVPQTPFPVPRSAPPARGANEPRRKRGTRIPDDFTVTADMVAWAASRCPNVDGRHETEKFVNYWRAKAGKDATKLDWPLTWRNWMLKAAESSPARGNVIAIRDRPSTTDQRVAMARAAGEEAQALWEANRS